MMTRHKSSIFKPDETINVSNEVEFQVIYPRTLMLSNVTNKAEMCTRNDRLISEMIRGGTKIELA